ncbi:hypothetical protein SAMN05421823_10318 [Catalinimonas alkaloidigena]|uniref:Uncharacterized protein n=1 Tax=Catalinimonas alkaloidigena TaxID=1075417 RepID=A0A1G9D6A5_9BACT|nr:hypothetical protein [Catalinimonas alkaloidigena]SDK59391.1 hypothetical protein SAMN05421823_10318 [Catalinimonas alkaloidigena]
MKYFTLFLLALSLAGSAAAQDIVDKMADAACACSSAIQSDDPETVQMEFGMCILKAAQPYAKVLQKKYGIDFTHIDQTTGEKLGRLIGMRMVARCPDLTAKLMQQAEEPATGGQTAAVASAHTLTGKLVDIAHEQFVTFHVQSPDGKITKVLWLSFFPNSNALMNDYGRLLQKQVTIQYQEEEFYNPRLGEYTPTKIITALQPED